MTQASDMTGVVLWHNPDCSVSREALRLLQDKGVEPTIRDYMDVPPNEKELREALEMLGGRPYDMIRSNEPMFRELDLSEASPDEVLLAAMAAHPDLIQRPIAFAAGRAVMGRPAERVLDVLKD